MAEVDLAGKDLRAIRREDFLFREKTSSGRNNGPLLDERRDWINPIPSFKAWRSGMLASFLALLLVSGVGVMFMFTEYNSLALVLTGSICIAACVVQSFIQNYLDEGVFEQQVRYVFKAAQGDPFTKDWVHWLGRAFELVMQSPVLIRRKDPWQFWCKDATNPAHFDWIAEKLRKLGIYIHQSYDYDAKRGEDTARDNRVNEDIHAIISAVDGLKERWMWSAEMVLKGSIFLATFGVFAVFCGLYQMFVLTH